LATKTIVKMLSESNGTISMESNNFRADMHAEGAQKWASSAPHKIIHEQSTWATDWRQYFHSTFSSISGLTLTTLLRPLRSAFPLHSAHLISSVA